jgi:hypothetical protein
MYRTGTVRTYGTNTVDLLLPISECRIAHTHTSQQRRPPPKTTTIHGFEMSDFCFQYDLRIRNGNVNGVRRQRVYQHIDHILLQRGYQKYQHSCWRLEGPSGVAFHIFIHAFANAVEGRFGAGAFRSLHYEQRFNLMHVR